MNDQTPDGRPAATARQATVLTRSRRQKVIAGVCGGAGRAFGIDPVVFRVALAILAVSGGTGLVAYGIGWLLIPMEGEEETELRRLLSGRVEGTALTAALCVLGGSALFMSSLGNGDNEAFSLLLLGALVGAVYWSRQRQARAGQDGETTPTAASTVSGTPPAAGPPPTVLPSWWRERHPGGYLWGPDDEELGDAERVRLTKTGVTAGRPGDGDPGHHQSHGSQETQKSHGYKGYQGYHGYHGYRGHWRSWNQQGEPGALRGRSARPKRSRFGWGAFLLAVFAAAGAIGLSWQHRPLGTTLEIGLAAALAVLGLSLVVGAFLGHAGVGTLYWALVASVLLAGAAALPKSVGTRWPDLSWRPVTTAQLQARYHLGTGQGVLDLTGLDLHGRTVTSSADVGTGRLLVRVPQDATVQLAATVGLGSLQLPDSTRQGFGIGAGHTRTVTLPPPAGYTSGGTVRLRLNVGVGQLDVLRGQQSP